MTGGIVHGGIDPSELARFGLTGETVCDFSVNSNPFGPSPRVVAAMRSVDLSRYPDRACAALRAAICNVELAGWAVALDEVLCGNGAAELVWAITRARLVPDARGAIIGPTFGEYVAACAAAGVTVSEYQASAAAAYRPDVIAVRAWLVAMQPAIVWLCNPNNPTGHWLPEVAVREIAATCAGIGAWLVVDEAYWRFLVPAEPFSAVGLVHELPDTVVVLRSLTKDYALAGLRLGYLVAAPAMIARIAAQLPSWNVSGPAQAAGIAAMNDETFLADSLARLHGERAAFFTALGDAGFSMVPSRTHYCLVDVGDGAAVRATLLPRGLLVRDCASFGLPRYIRVATRPEREWRRLVAALEDVCRSPVR